MEHTSMIGSEAPEGALYNEFWRGASDYVRFNPGSRHRRRQILHMLEKVPFQDVADIGCGNAELLQAIAAAFPGVRSLTGADLSGEVVAANRRRFPGLSFYQLNIERAALPQQFDLVVCSEVIEHLDDRGAAFRNLASMLRPGGHLLITCPTGKVYETDRHFGHTTHPTVEELHRLAFSQGLTVRRLERWGWPMLRLFKELVNLRPAWSVRTFASGAYTLRERLAAEVLYGLNFLNYGNSPRGCQLFALLQRA